MPTEGSIEEQSRHKLLAQMLGRSLDDRLRLDARAALPVPADDGERRLVQLFDGQRTLGEVLSQAPLGAARLQRVLQKLQVLGVLIQIRPQETPPLEPAERSAIEAEHARIQSCNFYELLGISPTASGQDIQRAYDRLARKFRPDAYSDRELGDALPMLHAISAKHLEAYDTLNNTKGRRKAYDESLFPESRSTKDAKKEFERGLRAFRRKDFKKAIPHLEAAVELEPDNAAFKERLDRARRILDNSDDL